jgi:hypothetical protein
MRNPTFNYLYWEDNIIKLKYSESQIEYEANYETQEFEEIKKNVTILFVIDCKNGLIQIRFDKSGNNHVHKNDENRCTDAAYENYYKELLLKLFPEIIVNDLNLNFIANFIANNINEKFRINAGTTTISNGAKQKFTTASIKNDIRNIPEYNGAASVGKDTWLAEDLNGYWLAEGSDGQLRNDLFMRISRKFSQIRVQRGCLEKELNYAIGQIRQIQNEI